MRFAKTLSTSYTGYAVSFYGSLAIIWETSVRCPFSRSHAKRGNETLTPLTPWKIRGSYLLSLLGKEGLGAVPVYTQFH